MGFPGGSAVKNPSANAGDLGSVPGLGRFPQEGNDTPVFLPGKFHGQRSLVGYSPWGSQRVGYNRVTNTSYIFRLCI